MRLVLRIVGTWLIGVALVLLVADGTRSLGSSGLVVTSFETAWNWLAEGSLDDIRSFLTTRMFGPLLETAVDAVLAAPAAVVLAVPGAVLAWMGRSRRVRLFVEQGRI